MTFENERGLALDGILYGPRSNNIVVVHVHGSYGNFYQNRWLRTFAEIYNEAGISFFSFNLTGHDGFAEGFRGAAFEYIGGAFNEFEECLYDIGGAIAFLRRQVVPASAKIILQGHSMGCERVIFFQKERGTSFDSIFIGPCDSFQLQQNWIAPERIEAQILRLRRARELEQEDVLCWRDYGVRQGLETYPIPILRRTLLKILEGPVFQLLRFDLGAADSWNLDSRCAVYIGGRDELQTVSAQRVFEFFEQRTRGVLQIQLEAGDHELRGCEREVALALAAWILSLA